MSEHFAVVLDPEGNVVNTIVVPADDRELGEAFPVSWRRSTMRRLTPEERDQGIGQGWKRHANGRFTDERPKPEPPEQAAPPAIEQGPRR